MVSCLVQFVLLVDSTGIVKTIEWMAVGLRGGLLNMSGFPGNREPERVPGFGFPILGPKLLKILYSFLETYKKQLKQLVCLCFSFVYIGSKYLTSNKISDTTDS